MVAGCGMTVIKYIVFAVNFLIFVLGVAGVALGIYALVDDSELAALTKIDSDGKMDDFNAVGLIQCGAIVLIVGGSCLLILGFLGCCGAVKEIKCLLAIYAAIIILIIIIEVAAAVIAIVFKDTIQDKLEESLIFSVNKYYDGNLTSDDPFSRAFDFAQVTFDCCGVNSTDNFRGSPWFRNKAPNEEVPVTCCVLQDKDKFFDDNKAVPKNPNCPFTAPAKNNPNTDTPCVDNIIDWVEDKTVIIIGIAFAIVAVEILAVIFACCLYRSIED